MLLRVPPGATPCNKVCPGTALLQPALHALAFEVPMRAVLLSHALASAMCEFERIVREELIELQESAMHYQLLAESLEDNARQQRSSRCSELPVLHAELQALLKKIRLSFGREMLSHAASAFGQIMDHDDDAVQTKPPSLGLKTLEVHAENLQAASAQLSVLRTQAQRRDLLTRKSRPSEEALQRANLMLRPWLHGAFRAKASDTAIERPAHQRHHDENFALSRHGAIFTHDMQHLQRFEALLSSAKAFVSHLIQFTVCCRQYSKLRARWALSAKGVASRKREALPAAAGVVQR
jgi:hypothetical protein